MYAWLVHRTWQVGKNIAKSNWEGNRALSVGMQFGTSIVYIFACTLGAKV